MKTRICRLHGLKDIRIEEIPAEAPGPGQVLLAVGAGGICGSDLHYYFHGGIGAIKVREPIIPGHEAAGTVVDTGPGVSEWKAGDRVAVNPSHPCGKCKFCERGLFNHCLEMRYLGSAMYLPHTQGLFRETVAVDAGQCYGVGEDITLAEAACAEPLAVGLHALGQAGEVKGRKVLVTGSGPIGVLCASLAAGAGAERVVVTDILDAPLAIARQMGADETINAAQDSQRMAEFAADKGFFDLCFECSAAAPAVRSAVEALRPRGVLVQVGVTAELPLPVGMIVGKEIEIRGSHRFHPEFRQAVESINTRSPDVRPLISHRFSPEQVVEAFETAADRSRAMKVQLRF